MILLISGITLSFYVTIWNISEYSVESEGPPPLKNRMGIRNIETWPFWTLGRGFALSASKATYNYHQSKFTSRQHWTTSRAVLQVPKTETWEISATISFLPPLSILKLHDFSAFRSIG